MIWYIVFIILLFFLAIINNTVSKKILYPPTYMSLIWFFLVIIHLFFRFFSEYTPNLLSLKTLSYFLIVNVMFSLGGIMAKGLCRKNNWKAIKYTLPDTLINIFLFLNLVFLLFYFFKVKELTGSFTNLRMFRYYTSVQRIDIGLIKYCITFSIFISVLSVIDYFTTKKQNIIRLLVILLSSVILTILTGSRGSLFFLLLGCLGVYSAYRKIKVKLLLKSILITLTLFIFMATALNKAIPNAYKNKREYNAIEKVEYFLYSYSTLALSAFDKFFNEPYEISNGDIFFRFPKTILYKTGVIDDAPKKLVEEYVKVPDNVNVYTAFYKMIKDFGVIYSFLFMMFIGFIHSYFFFNYRRKFQYLIGFVLLLFPLTMSFFEENYMSIFSTWIQIILYTYIFKKLIRTEYE